MVAWNDGVAVASVMVRCLYVICTRIAWAIVEQSRVEYVCSFVLDTVQSR